MSKWGPCLAALIVLLALPAAAAPVEQRCTELGSACVCSEPLRYTIGGAIYEEVDPPDSEGAGAKECNGGFALDAEPTGMQRVSVVDNATDLDFPTASSPPLRVLKMTSQANDGDNGWQLRGNQPAGVQNRTICGRSYQRFGNDLPPAVEPMRIKVSQAVYSGILYQDGITNGGGLYDIHGGDCTGTVNMQLAGRTSWIRHEMCIDVGTTSATHRGRMVVIETGVTDTVTCGPFSVSTPFAFDEFMIGNLFLQTDGDPSLFGSRYITHGIQTSVPLDPNFWPGPAKELESDSDGDGVLDNLDNCLNVANSNQYDANKEGFGNMCDADYNDNGVVNGYDVAAVSAAFGATPGDMNWNPEHDRNGNGVIDGGDVSYAGVQFGLPPGPSGLACAGTIPCP